MPRTKWRFSGGGIVVQLFLPDASWINFLWWFEPIFSGTSLWILTCTMYQCFSCVPKEPCTFPAQPTVSYGMWGLRLCCLWQLALCTKCTSALASVCLPDPMVVGTTSWQYHWMHAEDARVSPLVPCCPAFFEWLVSTPFSCYRNYHCDSFCFEAR